MNDDPTHAEPPGPNGEEARLRALLRAASDRVPSDDPFSAIYAVRRAVRRRRLLRTATVGCAVLALGAAGIGASIGLPAPRPAGSATTSTPYRLTGALTSFDGCPDYLNYVRTQAAASVGPYGLQQPGPLGYGIGSRALGGLAQGALLTPEYSPKGAAPAQANSAGLGPPVEHSGTNNQVSGVDEPDTVKTDGRVVLTLAGSTLRVLDTKARVIGSLQIDGDTGGGLLLAGNRAIILSSNSQPPSLGGGLGGAGYYPLQAMPSPQAARAVVVDISDPNRPRLVRTFVFDGNVVAARLVDNQIRLVLRSDGPRITFQTPTSTGDTAAATSANRRLIDTSSLDDWLPGWQVQRPDGSTTARAPLAACGAVARPQNASGISTVSVLSLDPDSTTPGPATSVVAAGDTVYATADHLYVAGITGGARSPAAAGGAALECCPPYQPGDVRTRLYDFETAGLDRPRFVGAGEVSGTLLDSYAMDQGAGGFLRVASTVRTATGATDSRITVLALAGHALTPVGVVAGLGHGQTLRAVRFLGDAAYVVTFQTFDPLYVVDLRDPRKPVVAGQLEQPGFSEFLYPLPGGRLLGVGVEIANNEPSGLLVATYDVADPAHPHRIQASELAKGFGFATGGFDPHAFLYWQPAALAVVSVPANGVQPSATGAAAYRIGADGQLTQIATLTHGTMTPTRTIVFGRQVWAVTPSGVIVSDLATLQATSWHPY